MSSQRDPAGAVSGTGSDATVRRGPGFWLAYAAGWILYSGLILSADISQGGSVAGPLRTVTVAALPGALLGAVVAARRRDFFRPDRGLLGMVGLHVVTGVPGLTGVEVLEAVTHRPAVVFTTAFDEYAVSAFELGAVDYLVKPFGKERLLECLGRVRVRLAGEGMAGQNARDRADGAQRRQTDRVFARKGEAIVPVMAREIVWIDAEADAARIVTADGTFRLSATLAEIEEKLDPLRLRTGAQVAHREPTARHGDQALRRAAAATRAR